MTSGASLPTSQAFRAEISRIAVLDRDGQLALALRAKAGDPEAYSQMIEECQRFNYAVACRLVAYYQSVKGVQFDPMDLVMEAAVRLLERRQTILSSPRPAGAMRVASVNAMRTFCMEQASIIRVPQTSQRDGKRAPRVVSLDAVLSEEGLTLLDLVDSGEVLA
jgi:hypothetical protein